MQCRTLALALIGRTNAWCSPQPVGQACWTHSLSDVSRRRRLRPEQLVNLRTGLRCTGLDCASLDCEFAAWPPMRLTLVFAVSSAENQRLPSEPYRTISLGARRRSGAASGHASHGLCDSRLASGTRRRITGCSAKSCLRASRPWCCQPVNTGNVPTACAPVSLLTISDRCARDLAQVDHRRRVNPFSPPAIRRHVSPHAPFVRTCTCKFHSANRHVCDTSIDESKLPHML